MVKNYNQFVEKKKSAIKLEESIVNPNFSINFKEYQIQQLFLPLELLCYLFIYKIYTGQIQVLYSVYEQLSELYIL